MSNRMPRKSKVDVTLLGHRFTVRTERDEAWVHGLAAHVARRLEEAKRMMRNASREEQVLFVALNLADELFEEAERAATSRAEVRRHTEQMVQKLVSLGAVSLDSVSLDGDVHAQDGLADHGSLDHGAIEDESDEIVLSAIQRQL